MNANELRLMAEHTMTVDIVPPYCEAMARHILATVRDDDDEAVTVEWYRQSGFRNSFVDPSSIMIAGTVIVDHDTLDATVCNGKPKLKTRGDVRKLCTALGIELKEPQQ